MVLEINGPQLQSANMLEEVEFYRALFELYEGGVVCPILRFNGLNCSHFVVHASRIDFHRGYF
jgi:hypothetical protein